MSDVEKKTLEERIRALEELVDKLKLKIEGLEQRMNKNHMR